jgi:enoyl-CoA hydratase/carnithine racemase
MDAILFASASNALWPHIQEVVFEHHGTAGVARLNRPKALNSLNLNMVRLLTQQYKV